MSNHLNYWGVLAAAVSAFVVGALWYKIFSAPWKNANGFEKEPTSGSPAKIFGFSFLFSLVMAFNLAKFLDSPTTTAASGATAGFLAGCGWCFMGIGIICLFERKPWSYVLINGGFLTVALTIPGLILGAFAENVTSHARVRFQSIRLPRGLRKRRLVYAAALSRRGLAHESTTHPGNFDTVRITRSRREFHPRSGFAIKPRPRSNHQPISTQPL